jgi:hypothetical protein
VGARCSAFQRWRWVGVLGFEPPHLRALPATRSSF